MLTMSSRLTFPDQRSSAMAQFGEPLAQAKPEHKYLPKFIKNYLLYVTETEPAPIHHLGSALALASQAIGGASYVRYGSKEVHMNLYIGLTAPSGYRKTEAIRLAMSVYSSASERFDSLKPPLPDISSNTAILQACDHRNNERTVSVMLHDREHTFTSVFIVASEFASFIRSRDKDMITLLTNLFDGAVSTDTFTYRTQLGGHFKVTRPYTVVLMASTPEWFTEHLPKGATQGGFTNRFLFLYSEQYRPKAFPQSEPDIADKYSRVVDDLIDIASRNHIISWTPEAQRLFADWYTSTQGGILQEPEQSLHSWTSRLALYLIKLAGISAFSDKRLYIQPEDLEFAWNIMVSARAGTLLTLRAVGSTIQGWLEHRVAFRVKNAGPQGIRVSAICRELSAESSASEIRKALRSLSELGIIRLDPNTDLVFPRRPQIDEFLRNPKEGWDLTWDRIAL